MAEKTAAQLADEATHDVMAFAYTDTDGKLYTVNQSGNRVEAPAGATPLSPEYQKIAESTAALVMSYSKIINLTPEDRRVLAQLASGQRSVDETLSAGVRDAWQGLTSAAKDAGVAPSVPGAGIVSGAAGLASDTISGFGFLSALFGDTTTMGGDVVKQLGGGTISRENAIAIGIAYASARQVAAAGRPANPQMGEFFKGVFSRHFGSYLGAGLSWLLDKAAGFAEHIPGIGDWIKQQGWASNKTLGQHLEASSRDADNAAVADEMREFERIGGQKTAEVAPLLTTGGTVRDSAGNEIPVAAADKDQTAPGLAGAAGAGAPTTPDQALANAEANKRPLLERLKGAVSGADFSATAASYGAAGPVGIASAAALSTAVAHRVIPGGLGAVPSHTANAGKAVGTTISNAARGSAAGFLQGSADTFSAVDERRPLGNSFAQAHHQTNGLERLRMAETQAIRNLEDAASRQPRGRIGTWFNERAVDTAQKALDTAKENVRTAEAAMDSGPKLGTSKMAQDALKISDAATDVMGAAGTSRLGTLARASGRLLGRAAPIATPLMAANDFNNSAQAFEAGKNREGWKSFASGGTVTAGAAVGAGIGVWFFGAGAIPGAAIGAGVAGTADFVGGLFGHGSKDIAGRTYDALHQNQPAPTPTTQPPRVAAVVAARQPQLTNAEIVAALQANPELAQQFRMATGRAGTSAQAGFNPRAFASVSSTQGAAAQPAGGAGGGQRQTISLNG